jgi:hypothetical protein
MLQVVQYLYPSGPPRGIVPPDGMESDGGGGRIGEEIGGSIPGSVVAHFQRE